METFAKTLIKFMISFADKNILILKLNYTKGKQQCVE